MDFEIKFKSKAWKKIISISSAERRRAELIATVKQSRKEFAADKCKPASVAAIMRQVKA